MEKYLIIERKHHCVIRIKDTITDCAVTYYGYTENQAIRKHRENFNIRGKHMIKIYI